MLSNSILGIHSQEISKPVTWHKFGSPDVDDLDDDVGPYFISAVCWKSDSPTMLTANSQGTIKVLTLSAWIVKFSEKWEYEISKEIKWESSMATLFNLMVVILYILLKFRNW